MKVKIDTKLPSSWILASIGEIADYVQRGKSPKYTDWSELPVINQKCIRWHGIDSEYLKFIHPEQWEKWSQERFLQEGDILWNSTGTGTIGRAAIYQGLSEYKKAVVDSHVTIVRTKNYNQKLLQYWIMSPAIQFKIDGMYTGSTNQVELSKTEVLSTSLPLPPLNEQKRIVTKIEALQTRSTAVKEELEAIKPLLNQFRQSVLASAFRGDLTEDWREQNPDVEPASKLIASLQTPNPEHYLDIFEQSCYYKLPKSWTWVQVGKLGTLLGGGTPSKRNPSFWKGYIPWISAKDMKIDRIKDSIDHITEEAISKSSAKLIPQNSILFVVRGMILNHTLPIAITDDVVTINQDMKALVPEITDMSEYLLFACKFVSKQILFKVKSATHGTRRLETSTLKDWAIPIPPILEQKEIVRRIESLFKLADNIEQQYQQAGVELETLNQSILAKAFRGELVPQDPNDEPASVLLERIKEERDKAKTTAKKSKTKKKRSSKKKDEQLGIPGM